MEDIEEINSLNHGTKYVYNSNKLQDNIKVVENIGEISFQNDVIKNVYSCILTDQLYDLEDIVKMNSQYNSDNKNSETIYKNSNHRICCI